MKEQLSPFADLSWSDLKEWAGSKVVSRGKSYQQQGRVSELAKTEDGGLLAWVAGSKRYANKVSIDENGQPESVCTCPYSYNCRHGVAVALEYLAQVDKAQRIPQAPVDDARLELIQNRSWEAEDDEYDEPAQPKEVSPEIKAFLKGKTNSQLIELVLELAQQYPEIGQAPGDRLMLTSGKTNTLMTRLRKEIQKIGEGPGWQDRWRDEGYTPNYLGIRDKLVALLNAGHAGGAIRARSLTTVVRGLPEDRREGQGLAQSARMPFRLPRKRQVPMEAGRLAPAGNRLGCTGSGTTRALSHG